MQTTTVGMVLATLLMSRGFGVSGVVENSSAICQAVWSHRGQLPDTRFPQLGEGGVLVDRLAVEAESAPRSTLDVIVSGVLINILNPKLTIFFFAFLPQFVSAGEPNAVLSMLELSAVFMLLTFVVFGVYGVFAAAVRDHVVSRPRVMTWMRRAFAGSFVALGARLATTDR